MNRSQLLGIATLFVASAIILDAGLISLVYIFAAGMLVNVCRR